MARLLPLLFLLTTVLTTVFSSRPILDIDTDAAYLALAPSPTGSNGVAGAPESEPLQGGKRHQTFGESAIGGEAILCGLFLAVLVTVLAYIRVTRRRSDDNVEYYKS